MRFFQKILVAVMLVAALLIGLTGAESLEWARVPLLLIALALVFVWPSGNRDAPKRPRDESAA